MNAATSSDVSTRTTPSLRGVVATDAPFLRELFESAHPHLQFVPLPEDQLHGLIDMQWRAQRLGYATQWPDAQDAIIECAGQPVGRLLVHHGDVTTIVDIAVLPRHRNCGIGSAALSSLLAAADRDRRVVRLTVSAGNPAEGLYERLGFAPVGRRGLDSVMERRAR
jgi:ribosomal protein S18 acetylase RimI-like enzyme